MKTGIELIAEERAAQVSREGYDPTHDDEHADGEIGRAAAAYALTGAGESALSGEAWWPWEPQGFKPKDPIRDLTRAGALIAAEIDRRLRASEGHK